MSATALKQQPLKLLPAQPASLAGQAVDRLGYVQAEMAPLKKEESQLKSMLRATGESVVEGDTFRATISVVQPSAKTDWEAVARALASKGGVTTKVFDNVVKSNTTIGEPGEPRVSVKARQGA